MVLKTRAHQQAHLAAVHTADVSLDSGQAVVDVLEAFVLMFA